jgi:hypothetical protein
MLILYRLEQGGSCGRKQTQVHEMNDVLQYCVVYGKVSLGCWLQ